MKIGLTYDLRSEYLAEGYSELDTAEFDREETVDAIADALEQLGHETDRIGHARQLIQRLAAGSRWDLVFNICEGLGGPAREAQVPAILDVYGIPCTFSDPLMMALCLHKGLTKTVVAAAGVPTPRHAVMETEAAAARIDFPLPLFVKPVAEGTGKGVDPRSIVRTREELAPACARLLEQFHQPVLVETYLPGREFTVSILGGGAAARILGTFEIILREGAEPEIYSYENKEQWESRVEYRLVSAEDEAVREAERISLDAWRTLGCRDAGRIDIRCDDRGGPQFIEVNPLAGLHPSHSDLPMLATAVGMSYVELIGEIVASASERAVASPAHLRLAATR